MGCSNVEIPIFADTNLGTRLVVVVSPHTTANGFKKVLERAHLNCFPQLGQIKVEVVMVNRNSCFYHLPETLPLKHVFQHLKGIRSLHVKAYQNIMLYQLDSSEYVTEQIWDHYDVGTISSPTKLKSSLTDMNFENLRYRRKRKNMKPFVCLKTTLSVVSRIAHFSKMKKKKKKRKKVKKTYKFNCVKGHDEPLVVPIASFALPTYGCEGKGEKQHNSSPSTESHSEEISEVISVSGIINKYFSSHDEVNSSSRFSLEGAQTPLAAQNRARTYLSDLKVESALLSPFPPKTPLQVLDVPVPNGSISRASRNKSKRVEIGNRVISASKSLGVMTSKNKLLTPERLVPESASFIRSLVFEMSDED